MAKGRMINNAIAFDAKIHRLSCDTSRLAFTWLITFADVDGRTYGDPAIVRSMVFPRRTDVTAEDVEKYIIEWQKEGLIEWYERDGDTWIQFPNFDKNQAGLRKDREAPSAIPAPPLRTNSGLTPDEIPVKRTEVKLKEKKVITPGDIYRMFENNIQPITESTQRIVDGWIEDYPITWIPDATDAAVLQGVRKPAYVEAILKNWKTNGKDSGKKKPPADDTPTARTQ